ncbi:MAG: tetratricopeptide repeat protein [Planctomycetaceae bacterium]
MADDASSVIEARLRERVAQRPDEGAGWRLLGRHLLQQGRPLDSEAALRRAVALDPLSAAAHFDLARTLAALNEDSAAAETFHRVLELAPESEYAEAAQRELAALSATHAFAAIDGSGESHAFDDPDAGVLPADYRIRRFDGSDFDDPWRDAAMQRPAWWHRDRLDVLIETGVLFNGNVALAPLSRELAPDSRASWQGFFAPDVQLAVWDQPRWRSGPTLGGHFTLNEGNFRQYNLQSYRPGWFVELFAFHGERAFVPRVGYEFTHDEFDGDTLGNRHALHPSIAAYWNDRHASTLFWSIDHTAFADDGIMPRVTSQDGWTNVLGVAHDVTLPYRHWRLVRVGVDYSRADTVGSDFAYRGVSLFAESVFPIAGGVELAVQGSWGYRDYPDFQFDPSRNEHVWRAGAELRKHFTDCLTGALVINFDRFDSRNPLFDADRLLTGLVIEYRY